MKNFARDSRADPCLHSAMWRDMLQFGEQRGPQPPAAASYSHPLILAVSAGCRPIPDTSFHIFLLQKEK